MRVLCTAPDTAIPMLSIRKHRHLSLKQNEYVVMMRRIDMGLK